jgi:hypothetical protein
MRKRITLLSVLSIVLTLALACPGAGQDGAGTVRFLLDGEQSLTITGSSNVRDWEAVSETVRGTVIAGPAMLAWLAGPDEEGDSSYSEWFERVSLSVAVNSLESGISALNNTMYETLLHEDHPRIMYRLTEVNDVRQGTDSNEIMLSVSGVARAAGSDHPVEHELSITRLSADSFTVSGEIEMLITHFQIDPPTFMRGALVTEDEVTVAYRLQLRASD